MRIIIIRILINNKNNKKCIVGIFVKTIYVSMLLAEHPFMDPFDPP